MKVYEVGDQMNQDDQYSNSSDDRREVGMQRIESKREHRVVYFALPDEGLLYLYRDCSSSANGDKAVMLWPIMCSTIADGITLTLKRSHSKPLGDSRCIHRTQCTLHQGVSTRRIRSCTQKISKPSSARPTDRPDVPEQQAGNPLRYTA